jgi:putative nucleotidyltransferase with HDIG domain
MIRRRRGPVPVPAWRSLGFAALLTLLLVLVLFPLLPGRLHVREGDIASETITSPHAFSYTSQVIRQRLQDEAAKGVKDVIGYDGTIKSAQLQRLDDEIAVINQTRLTIPATPTDTAGALARGTTLTTVSMRATVLGFTDDEWRVTADDARRVLGEVLQEPFTTADLAAKEQSIPARVSTALTQSERDVITALVQPLVVATEPVDQAATQAKRLQAIQSVPPQPVSYAANQEIVRQGEPIDAGAYEALQAAGLLSAHLRLGDLAAVLLLAIAVAAALAFYLSIFQPPSLGSYRRLVLLASLIAGMVLVAKLYFPVVLPDQRHHFYPFALPVALAPMLVAAFFEVPLALMVAAVASVLVTFTAVYLPELSGFVGLTALQPLQMVLAFFLAGVAGVYGVSRADRINRYMFAGLGVAAACFLSVTAIWFLAPSRRPIEILWILLASGISGALAALLTVGAFALLGALFNISTRLQLMELGQLNAPLLRRLQDEAPGTFHHSILVGNLAERAADLIGADALLVRVGAYYHDIGKVSRPGFFIENQLNGQNPHAQLDPAVSAQIIAEHVRYGQELARRHHLPEALRSFVVEHHGTRQVTYFYRLAAQRDPDVDISSFTYPGPRPQSRETAIVMLADSTEAAARAAADRSAERIDALVEEVLNERLGEGQLDDCDLTLRDLRTIAASFKTTLQAIYHPRIEYPAPTPLEEARRSRLVRRSSPNAVVAEGEVSSRSADAAAVPASVARTLPSADPPPAEPARQGRS